MNTHLQSTSLTGDELAMPVPEDQEDELAEGEEEGHIHLPGGSYWPILLGVSILIAMAGFVVINTTPWVTIIGVVLAFICIMGWALQNPMPTREKEHFKPHESRRHLAYAALTRKPTPH